jgi:hypothetical protein
LGTGSVGEFAVQLPPAVAALPQLHMPPVLLGVISDRLVRFSLGHNLIRQALQFLGLQLFGVGNQPLLSFSDAVGLELKSGEFLHGPCQDLDLLAAHGTFSLRSSQCG